MSYLRTAILLAGLTALFMLIGYLIGGPNGAVIAFFVAAATNFITVLERRQARAVDTRRAGSRRARSARPRSHGGELAQRAELPMPRVFVIDNPQPNAFATGRNPQHARRRGYDRPAQTLSRDELAGVIAHELAHIRNRDTLLMTVTATIAGAISMLAQFGMFFGGGIATTIAAGRGRHPADGRAGAACRRCWFRWRSAARVNMPPTTWARGSAEDPAATCRGAGQDRCGSACDRECSGRAQPGVRASVHHQSVVGSADGQSLRHPSGDGKSHRGFATARDTDGPRFFRASARGPIGRRAVGATKSLGLDQAATASS